MEQWRKKPVYLFGYRVGERPIKRTEIEDELNEKFAAFPGVSFSFSQLIRDNIDEALSGIKGANSVKLFGGELDKLEEVGQRVVNVLRTVPGVENVGLFHIVGQPNLEIRIDRRAISVLKTGLLPVVTQAQRTGTRMVSLVPSKRSSQ